jgi:hypothetical protein
VSANNFLRLSGVGRLFDITYDTNYAVYFTFQLVNQAQNSPSSEVWIKCRGNLVNFPETESLLHYLNDKQEVKVHFDAQYLGFQQCFSGIGENDPESIVHLDGELLKIQNYYIEGDNLFTKTTRLLKNIVSHNQMINH